MGLGFFLPILIYPLPSNFRHIMPILRTDKSRMTNKRQQKKIAKGMTFYPHEKDFGLGQQTFLYPNYEFNFCLKF
jgi:hypothetical protein